MAQEKPIEAILLTPTKRQQFKVLHFDTLPRLFLSLTIFSWISISTFSLLT